MDAPLVFIIALVIFSILMFFLFLYLTFKIIQFIIVAINLYKEMIQNQKRMIELLKYNIKENTETGIAMNIKCPSCGATNETDSGFCEKCGKALKVRKDNSTDISVEKGKKHCISCNTLISSELFRCPKCDTIC
jgi:predicted RNA-binding Zn-ribbon protein involved in translation (DUF1610 family)